MKARNGEQVNKDDIGELWRIEGTWVTNWQSLTMVKVINATPEPDGSFREFWLQVPPWMQTAKQAVAWTFNMTEAEYDLVEAS